NYYATYEIYTLSLHDALPILGTNMEPLAVVSAKISTTRPEIYKNGLDETTEAVLEFPGGVMATIKTSFGENINFSDITCEKGERSEEHTSELQSRENLVCRLL